MTLAEHYPTIKAAHLGLVSASGLLFAVRGAAVLAGRRWPLRRAWRLASVVIDTALLLAGATLWWLLQLNPAREAWLGTKLALLGVYIALGTVALKRAPNFRLRLLGYAAALGVFGFIVSVARAHHPLGLLLPLFTP